MNEKAARLDPFKPVLVNCHPDVRGSRAAALLQDLGLSSVKTLEDGLRTREASGNKFNGKLP